jgi:alpha-N-arabinofuranosidase
VNVIAPIRTEPGGPAWKQSTFHVFASMAAHARGRSLVTRVAAPELPTRRYGDVPALTAAATHDPGAGAVALFVTNRADRPAVVEVRHAGFEHWATRSAEHLAADDAGPRNRTAATSVRLVPLPAHDDGGATTFEVPARSWTVLQAGTG